MKEKQFIKDSINQVNLENFMKKYFGDAKVSNINVQRTPLGTRIVVFTSSPGMVIGRKGENLRALVEDIKENFDIDNPNIDVRKIKNPDLDPNIVAKSIVNALKRGVNARRLGNYYLRRIMEAGAIGAEVVLSGLVMSNRSRKNIFKDGYIKKAGDTSENCVNSAQMNADLKRGTIGVSVSIMVKRPELEASNIKLEEEDIEEIKEEEEEKGKKKTKSKSKKKVKNKKSKSKKKDKKNKEKKKGKKKSKKKSKKSKKKKSKSKKKKSKKSKSKKSKKKKSKSKKKSKKKGGKK